MVWALLAAGALAAIVVFGRGARPPRTPEQLARWMVRLSPDELEQLLVTKVVVLHAGGAHDQALAMAAQAVWESKHAKAPRRALAVAVLEDARKKFESSPAIRQRFKEELEKAKSVRIG